MRFLTPGKTLLLLLAVAAVILGGGVRMARREETVRVPRNREIERQFADALQQEIQRLTHLYETHLRQLAHVADRQHEFAVREACDRVVGVRQFSWIHGISSALENTHLAISSAAGEPLSVPVIQGCIDPSASVQVKLSSDLLATSTGDSGWIDEPGKPLFFWFNQSSTESELSVLLIDPRALGEAMDSWISAWMKQPWSASVAAGNLNELFGSKGAALSAGGRTLQASETADFLLPIRTRFGVWQLASWDRRETRVHYHVPTVAVAACLSVLVALLGAVVSLQQRRALRHAERRVSFVNRVSHELRTPLTNILLNLDVAHELIDETGPPGAGRGLAVASEEARRLGRLIANVLTFSQIERGSARAQTRACVPAAIVSSVLEQFAASFSRRSLVLTARNDASTPCLLDPDALAQIIGNLLSNVEKYVPGGPVEVLNRFEHGWFVLQVADHGPGIAPVEAERIFLPFERLHHSVNEGASGAGLGLAIARDLAVMMGGSLRVLPSPNGALFELRVPAPDVPVPTAAVA